MTRYDVAVVGAGLAGQICANYLARDGRSVVLLEQSHHAGGNMSGFTRRGFSFDGGDQSFESLGIVLPILRDLTGVGPAHFEKARFRMVSKDFDFFVQSPQQVEDALRAAFPNEPGIAPLFREVREVSRFLESNYEPWSLPLLNHPSLGSTLRLAPWIVPLKRWSTYRYREHACRHIRSDELRRWFAGVGYQRMPFLFFAGFWHLWSYDYWHPKGGMQAMNDLLTASIRAAGGEVMFNTEVVRIDVDPSTRRATSIQTAAGERIAADTVVYAGDYKRLVERIVGPAHFPRRLVNRIRGARLTEGIVAAYLGLSMSDAELSTVLGGAHHPFYFPNYNVVFPDRSSSEDVHRSMWVALNHFAGDGPSARAGRSTLTVQTYSSYEWQDRWQNGGSDRPRSTAYRGLKERVGHELIEIAEHLVPGLRDRVEYMEVGSPISSERFSLNTEGATGGWSYDDRASPLWRPTLNRIRTPIENLLCAGHYAVWPGGVISAALSGRIVANLVSGRRALAPLRR